MDIKRTTGIGTTFVEPVDRSIGRTTGSSRKRFRDYECEIYNGKKRKIETRYIILLPVAYPAIVFAGIVKSSLIGEWYPIGSESKITETQMRSMGSLSANATRSKSSLNVFCPPVHPLLSLFYIFYLLWTTTRNEALLPVSTRILFQAAPLMLFLLFIYLNFYFYVASFFSIFNFLISFLIHPPRLLSLSLVSLDFKQKVYYLISR